MTRHLYLARHAEAEAEVDLTDLGREPARLLGARLRGASITAIHHSPAPRATQTAALVAAQLDVPAKPSDLIADYVPYLPTEAELGFAGIADTFISQFSEAEREEGPPRPAGTRQVPGPPTTTATS